jgi:hypothetical protein
MVSIRADRKRRPRGHVPPAISEQKKFRLRLFFPKKFF